MCPAGRVTLSAWGPAVAEFEISAGQLQTLIMAVTAILLYTKMTKLITHGMLAAFGASDVHLSKLSLQSMAVLHCPALACL